MELVETAVWIEVNSVLQRYADALDRADVPGILSLFTSDARWDYAPGSYFIGHEQISAFFQHRLSDFVRASHHISPAVVRKSASESDTYESVAYFIATHLLKKEERYLLYGRYVDTFVKTERGLLIKARRLIAHVTEGTKRSYYFLDRKS